MRNNIIKILLFTLLLLISNLLEGIYFWLFISFFIVYKISMLIYENYTNVREWKIIKEKICGNDRFFIIVKKKNDEYYRTIGNSNGYTTYKDVKVDLKRFKKMIS